MMRDKLAPLTVSATTNSSEDENRKSRTPLVNFEASRGPGQFVLSRTRNARIRQDRLA
jgi:hypothetical protein